jgi:hypothetical protein
MRLFRKVRRVGSSSSILMPVPPLKCQRSMVRIRSLPTSILSSPQDHNAGHTSNAVVKHASRPVVVVHDD